MPPADMRHPRLHGASFACPRCAAFAGQEWEDLVIREISHTFRPADDARADLQSTLVAGLPQAKGPDTRWRMSTCAACERASIWRGEDLIYPRAYPGAVPSEDMPADVRELYEEASAVATVSRRAGAALARATLERLLKNLDPEAPRRTRLDGYIERVSVRVSTHTAQMLTLIRHTGNKALHVEPDPDESIVLLLSDADAGILDAIFATINAVIDELITRPKVAEAYYATVPEGVRSAVEANTGASE